MKYVAESVEDVIKLSDMYVKGQITVEEYYVAIDKWASLLGQKTVKQESEWRSWIDTESIRGDRKSWWQRFKQWFVRVLLE